MFPLIAPLVSSVVGGLLSRERRSPEEKQVLANQAEAGKLGLSAGKDMLSMGTTAYRPVVDYLSQILSSQGGAMTSAAGPEIFKIGQGYQDAARTSAALSPRGGPSAEFAAELPWMQQRDVTQLLQGLRPQAAGQLGSAAGNILGNAVNSLYLSTNAGRSILDSEAERKRLERERGTAFGASIFDFITKYGAQGGKSGLDQIMDLFRKNPSIGGNLGGPIWGGDGMDIPGTSSGLLGNG